MLLTFELPFNWVNQNFIPKSLGYRCTAKETSKKSFACDDGGMEVGVVQKSVGDCWKCVS